MMLGMGRRLSLERLRQRPPPPQTSSSSSLSSLLLLPLGPNHPKKDSTASTTTTSRRRVALTKVHVVVVVFLAWIIYIIVYCSTSATFTNNHHNNDASSSSSSSSSTRIGKSRDDYIMWSNEEAYFADCRRSMIKNQTWGDPLAPLVDKVTAKSYAQQWSPSVQIVPTIATFDIRNISLFTSDYLTTMASQQKSFIIKPSHMTGLVLRVVNDTLTCIKGCNSRKRNRITQGNIYDDPNVYLSMMEVLRGYMTYDFSTKNGQTQYHLIPPRIVLEQYLPMDVMKDVTYWYIAGGKPIFVSMECADPATNHNNNNDGRIYSTASYQRLLGVQLTSKACVDLPPKPKSWERMRRIAEEEIGPKIPPGVVVRLDLYAGDTDVYFSEFTFTSAACGANFRPRVVDGLLYAVNHGVIIPSTSVTPDLVRDVIMDTSWVPVFVSDDIALNQSMIATTTTSSSLLSTSSFPSPVDLCLSMPGKEHYDECIEAAKTVAHAELRCVVHEEHTYEEEDSKSANNATTTTSSSDISYHAIGAPRSPTFASVWSRVPQDKIGILLVLYFLTSAFTLLGGTNASILFRRAAMQNTKSKAEEKPRTVEFDGQHHDHRSSTTTTTTTTTTTATTRPYNRFRNNIILYHLGLALYMYYTSENDGMFSSHSLPFLVNQSFDTFRTVHPMSSPMIIIFHFATYWLNVAAWTAPSLQSLFLRQSLAEFIPPLVNEYAHHTEVLENVRCMRMVFIDSVQRHVVDEIIRGYFLPQFFVYFYLLPKFVLHHMGFLAVTGDSFVAVFAFHVVALLSILCGFKLVLLSKQRKHTRLQLPC